jgi:hypothetical protein
MPLPPAEPRELIHTRTITCRGYRRRDGLWDVEGHLTDVKAYSFDNRFRDVAAGEPVHDMWLRLTVDDRLHIHAVAAATDQSPYPDCPAITANFQRLAGLAIRPGFNRKVKELLGGIAGCTHLVELIGPVATTAYQTVYPYREQQRQEQGGPGDAERPRHGRKPHLLESCHAFRSDGAVVKMYWPEFYTGG